MTHDGLRIALPLEFVDQSPVTNLFLEELIQIQTTSLGIIRDAKVKAGNVLHDEKKSTRHGERVGRDGGDLGKLSSDLNTLSVNRTRCNRDAIQR